MKYSTIVKQEIEAFEKECQTMLEDPNFKLSYRIDTEGKEDTLYVDGDLYDVFTYGYGDYNFGSELYDRVWNKLQSLNVVMENHSGGVFKFYKV